MLAGFSPGAVDAFVSGAETSASERRAKRAALHRAVRAVELGDAPSAAAAAEGLGCMDGLGRPGSEAEWSAMRLDGLLEEFYRAGATDAFLIWLADRESVTVGVLREKLNRHVDAINRRIRNGSKTQARSKEKGRR